MHAPSPGPACSHQSPWVPRVEAAGERHQETLSTEEKAWRSYSLEGFGVAELRTWGRMTQALLGH